MRQLPLLFALSLFCSATLSFSIQPILGKMMLPSIGGAPSGWLVALAFFQLALLAGYGLSYALGRFSPWVHGGVLLGVYVVGAFFLPPSLPEISTIQDHTAWVVMQALFRTIFIPFLALTSTTAALQRVFAATRHPTAHDPYYLFVASNIGSFVGLLAYPFLIEPFIGLTQQAWLWQIAYAVAFGLIVASCLSAWVGRADNAIRMTVPREDVQGNEPSARMVLQWLILAFVPCSLSMGVTSLITTDLGGFPLFWVLPLALYLVTFILAFARTQRVRLETLEFYHIVAVAVLIALLALSIATPAGAMIMVLLSSAALLGIFFVIAWSCHSRLASMRPSVAHLPQYYFVIALGGAMAGMLHVFVIPFVMPYTTEFAVMAIASLLLVQHKKTSKNDKRNDRLNRILAIIIASVVVMLIVFCLLFKMSFLTGATQIFLVPLLLTLVTVFVLKPHYLLCVGVIVWGMTLVSQDVVLAKRNFFGVHRVYEENSDTQRIRFLSHGNTVHGIEVTELDEAKASDGRGSWAYYLHDGPIRDVTNAAQAQSWAVIGLGTGQLACFDTKIKTDFYEIDSDIEYTALDYFSYLTHCPPRSVIIGDGRLKLAASDEIYDVIVLDAFSSDGIPSHLVTVEAFRQYMHRMNRHGVILAHVSNNHIDLKPVLGAVANAVGLQALSKTGGRDSDQRLSYKTEWVAIPLDAKAADSLKGKGWAAVDSAHKAWTDDWSTLLTILRSPF